MTNPSNAQANYLCQSIEILTEQVQRLTKENQQLRAKLDRLEGVEPQLPRFPADGLKSFRLGK